MKKRFNIILEKGEAKKSIFDMTPEEVKEVSDKVWEIVKARAASIGQLPVVMPKRLKSGDKME